MYAIIITERNEREDTTMKNIFKKVNNRIDWAMVIMITLAVIAVAALITALVLVIVNHCTMNSDAATSVALFNAMRATGLRP